MIHPLWTALASFMAVTAASLVGLSLSSAPERATRRRLEAILSTPDGVALPRTLLLEQPFIKRALLPGVSILAKMGESLTPVSQRDRLVSRLQQAGIYAPQGLQLLLASKAMALALAVLALWLLNPINQGMALVGGAAIALLGILGPEQWISIQIAERKDALVRALPDALDLLTASVEAGLSFDGAVLRMTARESAHGRELRTELGRYMTDVRMGRTRAEALHDLARRAGIADLEGVVAAVIQADQLGVGIGHVLRTQSVHLRHKRRQRAQEAALKAPVKMLFPLVFFIFPVMFVITLGPALMRIMDTFAELHH